jgi:GNAT superfamily N-acetyltransferase
MAIDRDTEPATGPLSVGQLAARGPVPRRQDGTRPVRSCIVPDPVIRMAEPADVPALAALRRGWTAENGDDAADEGFEARFADWYESEFARRISWLAEVSARPVGMMNLAVFERMPVPGRDAGTWGYLANAFVLRPYRSQGIGGLLLSALLAYADGRGYVRVVLRPSDRSIPFYNRAGFTSGDGFLVRRGTR